MNYKETELGLIPSDWEYCDLKEKVDVTMGQSPKSEYYNTASEGMPFLQGRKTFGFKYPSIDTWCNNPIKIARKGDVLLSVRAPVGDLNVANRDICIGRGLASLRIKNDNNEFLYYLLLNYRNNIINKQTGTVFGSISKNDIEYFKLPFPPLHEQKAIAKILSDLDEKIEINNRINKVLQEIAQTIFKRWFIDFEFPNENGEPYKSSGGEMIDSELGPIPKVWEVVKLGDIGEFKNGINYNRKEEGNKTYGIVNVRDIVKEAFITKTNMDNVIIDSEKANQYLLNKGDILIVRSAAPGKVGILLKEESDIIYSGFIILFRLFDYKYIYFMFMMLKDLDKRLDTYANGTTLKNINQQILKNIKIILPDDKIVEMFNNIVIQFFDKITFIKEENQNLSQLRDALLPKLMSGEIRVELKDGQIVLKDEC